MDMKRLPWTSKHITFLLLCQLDGESPLTHAPHLLGREVFMAGCRLQVPGVSEAVLLFVTWDSCGHGSNLTMGLIFPSQRSLTHSHLPSS